ncbi:MAG: hypothetical protein SGCHY_001019 [Lobulomycetales sp.]
MATSFVGRAFSNARKTFTHYFNASKEIRGNSVQVARLLASGHALSWRQWRLVQRSRQDTRRIIPFGLMLLLLPEAIPFALRFAPWLVPRTAWTTEQVHAHQSKLDARRAQFAASIIAHDHRKSLEQLSQWAYQHYLPHAWSRDQCSVYASYLGLGALASSRYMPLWWVQRRLVAYFALLEKEDEYFLKQDGILHSLVSYSQQSEETALEEESETSSKDETDTLSKEESEPPAKEEQETPTEEEIRLVASERGIITTNRPISSVSRDLLRGIEWRRQGVPVEIVFFQNVLDNAPSTKSDHNCNN